MKSEKKMIDTTAKDISIFICGGEADHDFSGPAQEFRDTSGVTMTAVCKKCGLREIDYDLLRLP
jgi:hypothetical protein